MRPHRGKPTGPRGLPTRLGALVVVGLVGLACGTGEEATDRKIGPRAARARELTLELPDRMRDDAGALISWVREEMLPAIGAREAERLLWTAPYPGSSTEDLGKLWLALEAVGRPADRERLFGRAHRPLENQPAIEFVAVAGGSFSMGSEPGERGRQEAEGPVREIRVAAFELAATPITNLQFESFDPLHARRDREGLTLDELDDHPVVDVSWWDAFVFSLWLDARLPSEAEWEYACRAGNTTRFWSGDSSQDLERAAWFFDNSAQRTHSVATRAANPWGLFDMHGNVFEWCRDAWRDGYDATVRDARPYTAAASAMRVYRGGAWNRYAEYSRSAFRGGWLPGERNDHLGFRIARAASR